MNILYQYRHIGINNYQHLLYANDKSLFLSILQTFYCVWEINLWKDWLSLLYQFNVFVHSSSFLHFSWKLWCSLRYLVVYIVRIHQFFFFYPWQQLTQGIFIYFAFILICVCVFMCVLSTHIYMWAKKQLYCILTNSILQCSCIAHFIYSSMPLVYFCDYGGQCW